MQYSEALSVPDAGHFVSTIHDKVNLHEENNHWGLVQRDKTPNGTTVLPSIRAFKRKRRAGTGEVYKHKARLNVGDTSRNMA